MLARCLCCYQPLPSNRTLEWFPLGRRVAFDPLRGRLWAVCPSCARWQLAPIEERWEALEELERLSRDRGRALASTPNIALLRAGELEIVRVGQAEIAEEAHWRIGRDFAARRTRARHLRLLADVGDGVVVAVSAAVNVLALVLLTTPVGVLPAGDSDVWVERSRRHRFGEHVWRSRSCCATCGRELDPPRFADRSGLLLLQDADGVALRQPCPDCGTAEPATGLRLTGVAAEHMLRRLLAHANYAGGDDDTLADAGRLLRHAGSPAAFLEQLAARGTAPGRLPPRFSIGLEIALSDVLERRLLQLEVAVLEARWRDEERLAAIVDGELTPPAGAPARA